MNPIPQDQALFSVAPFPTGTVIKWPEIKKTGAYRDTALKHFNSFTPERIFKAALIHPEPDQFHWTDADDFLTLCGSAGKLVHGHTLLWDRDLPAWFNNGSNTGKGQIEQHVATIVSRCRGRMNAWDVVNEAFTSDGALRLGNWWRSGGPHYLERAFRAAAEADDTALLFYNDFDLEVNEVKRHAVIEKLSQLRRNGVRVDGIGLQLHVNLHSFSEAAFRQALRELVAAGFLIHLSELDVAVLPVPGDFPGKQMLIRRQAEIYAAITNAFMAVPDHYRYGITFWGVGDNDSWIVSELKQLDYPLLFDADYEPKPAFFSVCDELTRHKR